MPNYRAMTRQAAARHGLDPRIFERQIQQESGFAEDVITGRRASSAGAQGIAQIMPATARGWGVNPLNPRQALDAAAKNMASYVRKYGGYENALRAYNAGPGAIQASKGYAETNNYVRTILGGKDPGRLNAPTRSGGGGGRTVTSSTPGVDNRMARAQLVQAFLSDKGADPVNFALQARALKDVPGVTSTRRVGGARASRAPLPAGGQKNIRELFWNGPGATNIDEGKAVGKGFVSDHTDHVHLAADRATMQRAAALAKSLGLNVGEYGKGISSGHATGSFHYQPYGAMDVSGDVSKMAQFAKRVGRGRL